MREAKELTMVQAKLVDSVGLFHTDWLYTFEDAAYMHLIRRGSNPAEIKIIDKKKRIALTPAKAI